MESAAEELEIVIPDAEVAAPPKAEAAAPEVETLNAKLAEAEEKGRDLLQKVKEAQERMLRSAADLENFRKRALKEREEVQKFGIEKLLKDFLPVVDNLDRALEHAKSSNDFESLRQGVAMTRKLFEDTLARHGVTTFSAAGKPFDPRLHEALQHMETNDLPPNHVVNEVIKGYMLRDRLVRPSLVIVSKAPSEITDKFERSEEPVSSSESGATESGPPTATE